MSFTSTHRMLKQVSVLGGLSSVMELAEILIGMNSMVAGNQLEKLMEQLRADLSANPPLPGAYTPKKGEVCAAKFTDGEW